MLIHVGKLNQIICRNAGCPVVLSLRQAGLHAMHVGRSYIAIKLDSGEIVYYNTPRIIEEFIVKLNKYRQLYPPGAMNLNIVEKINVVWENIEFELDLVNDLATFDLLLDEADSECVTK